MQRKATLTGPGIERSPSAQRRTVRASTSNAEAASTCDISSAASAALNSSADNDAILPQGQAGLRQDRAQGVERGVSSERVGQRTIAAEKRQALRAINTTADEADGFGRKRGDGLGLAHIPCVGPMALTVNT
jgi:hypothetical protein